MLITQPINVVFDVGLISKDDLPIKPPFLVSDKKISSPNVKPVKFILFNTPNDVIKPILLLGILPDAKPDTSPLSISEAFAKTIDGIPLVVPDIETGCPLLI